MMSIDMLKAEITDRMGEKFELIRSIKYRAGKLVERLGRLRPQTDAVKTLRDVYTGEVARAEEISEKFNGFDALLVEINDESQLKRIIGLIETSFSGFDKTLGHIKENETWLDSLGISK